MGAWARAVTISLIAATLMIPSGPGEAEPATVTGVTPLSSEYLELAYDTDDNGESDLFVIYTVVWQGWSRGSDEALKKKADQSDLGVIAVEAGAKPGCLTARPAPDRSTGWRYVYMVRHDPVQTCRRSGCAEGEDDVPSRP